MGLISTENALQIMQNIGISDTDEENIQSVKFKAAIVIAYMNGGGAKISADALTEYELGVIGIGVNDLLNNTSGGTDLSPAFDLFSKQICTAGDSKNGKTTA